MNFTRKNISLITFLVDPQVDSFLVPLGRHPHLAFLPSSSLFLVFLSFSLLFLALLYSLFVFLGSIEQILQLENYN